MNPKDLLNANIINLLGIEALPDDKKVEFIGKISDLIFRRVIIKVLDRLEDEDQERLMEYIESNDADNTTRLISQKIPDFEDMLTNEVVKIKEELYNESKNIN
jgi:hypothetical protein